MVVRELFVAMRHTELVQARTGGSIEQVKLIPLAAVDVERLQPREIVGLSLDRDHRVLPQPVSPALLDDLAGVEDDRQADRRRTCSCVLLRRGRFRTPLFRRPECPSRVPASALCPFGLLSIGSSYRGLAGCGTLFFFFVGL